MQAGGGGVLQTKQGRHLTLPTLFACIIGASNAIARTHSAEVVTDCSMMDAGDRERSYAMQSVCRTHVTQVSDSLHCSMAVKAITTSTAARHRTQYALKQAAIEVRPPSAAVRMNKPMHNA